MVITGDIVVCVYSSVITVTRTTSVAKTSILSEVIALQRNKEVSWRTQCDSMLLVTHLLQSQLAEHSLVLIRRLTIVFNHVIPDM